MSLCPTFASDLANAPKIHWMGLNIHGFGTGCPINSYRCDAQLCNGNIVLLRI